MEQSKQLDWLRQFLWHWQESGVFPGEAAEVILQNLQQASEQSQAYEFPDAQSLVKTLGSE